MCWEWRTRDYQQKHYIIAWKEKGVVKGKQKAQIENVKQDPAGKDMDSRTTLYIIRDIENRAFLQKPHRRWSPDRRQERKKKHPLMR